MGVIVVNRKFYILLLALFLISTILMGPDVSFVYAANDSSSNQNSSAMREIEKGVYYNVKSSIFVWFNKLLSVLQPSRDDGRTYENQSKNLQGPFRNNVSTYVNESNKFREIIPGNVEVVENRNKTIQELFVENVRIYESEKGKYSKYWELRNFRINLSYSNTSEPPFDRTICPESMPITADTHFGFCSCGDGFCATYEDKCTCPKDCGTCPTNTVCKRGDCVELVEKTCMNTVCEEGERQTCPWDCKITMIEEQTETHNETPEEAAARKERARNWVKEFVESHGEIYTEGNKSR